MKESPKAMDKTDNEIIAEFYGATLDRATSGGRRLWSLTNLPEFCKQIDIPESRIRVFYTEDLEFDTSWDWLMPVVEKIESLHDTSYLCRIVSRRCIIYDSNIADQASVWQGSGEGIIASSINQDSKLIACHKAVVQFIKFYNSQNNGQ